MKTNKPISVYSVPGTVLGTGCSETNSKDLAKGAIMDSSARGAHNLELSVNEEQCPGLPQNHPEI